ncbi:histidine phosphatase family protein [Cytobacillus purgationiresistens]|uniref:2,3-bisphosphoglycerate-dependent phosphoglycerate mutase n=1 Tax=Cytobacillus purgationiresistens TaxID=863449 RepID=A0ABU0AAS2_9BACI|nr:histidine phosphatase family protein [Cytobacillus purgationiresistens]MDQ0268349.1 2,3-bisphosphoglycerate-dependent phosphoglycerate mutase [Cytobacillus purgationiresistens]
MTKKVYLIRHCEALGQPPEAPLTKKGEEQAKSLAEFFKEREVDKIVSSPFIRAKSSINKVSTNKKLDIEMDERLKERVLSTEDLPNWRELLQLSFTDLNLKPPGGESSLEAMNRIAAVINEVLQSESENILIVSHGNLLSLLLKKYDEGFGFESWQALTNPDVYQLTFFNENMSYKRIWSDK